MRGQRGAFIVDFAVAAPVAFIVLFGCIEIGRALFVWNTVVEATRRGARVATVVTPSTGAATIKAAVKTFANPAALADSNIQIAYYDSSMVQVTDLTKTGTMAFVTVGITGVTVTLHIPLVNPTLTVPAFSTTVPAESLGFNPDT